MMTDEANAIEAARHNHKATILMSDGSKFDFLNPESTPVDIESYAYALAYTVRFRGQCKSRGQHVFYGVGEHCCRVAENMIREGYSREQAREGLMHEPGEVPYGDMPGPAKPTLDGFKAAETRCGNAILANLGIKIKHPQIVKRFDIRIYLTERRDLMPGPVPDITPGYEPFEEQIIPYRHPDLAARRFLQLYRELAA